MKTIYLPHTVKFDLSPAAPPRTISVVTYDTHAVFASSDHQKCRDYCERRVKAEFAAAAHLWSEERGHITYYHDTPFRITAGVTLELDP